MARNKQRTPKVKKPTPGAQSQEARQLTLTRLQLPYLRELVAKSATVLTPQEHTDLSASIETLTWLMARIANKNATLTRLRRALFGNGSESLANLLAILASHEPTPEEGSSTDDLTPALEGDGPKAVAEAGTDARAEAGAGPAGTPLAANSPTTPEKAKAKGHGRQGVDQYPGAKRCPVSHQTLTPGQVCPACGEGKVYRLAVPAMLVRIEGIGPLVGTIYELSRLRCNRCGQVFTARPPEGVGIQKYDQSATALVALLRYGCGMPFHRLSRLQKAMGLPLPSSTAFELVEAGADALEALYDALMWEAAQGSTLYNDDTWVRILKAPEPLEPLEGQDRSERTGLFTTGVLSEVGGRRIALYFTGRQHAGENLREVLLRRASGLGPPVQMSDALSRNAPKGLETIEATCLAHARRNFVEVGESFPEEVKYVLLALGAVYHEDAQARRAGLDDQARLAHHQTHSRKVMEELRTWMQKQLDDKAVEPHSGLGKAMNFMLRRWETFTVFLRVAGAPLDNNITEKALKRAILHRRNSLFFKTWNGARVADLYMTLIHTCEHEGQDPFAYLKAVLENAASVETDPSAWLPWTWKATLAARTQAT